MPDHLRGLLGIHLPRDCFDMVLHLSQMVNTHGVAPPAVELPVDEDEDVMDYEGDESNDSAYDSYNDDHPSVYDDEESDADTVVLSD